MDNEILLRRICKMIAINYAIKEETVWHAYIKLQSIDKVLNLIRSGQMEKIVNFSSDKI